MDNKIIALALIACVAVVATAVIYVAKIQQPAQGGQQPAQGGDELSSVDNQLGDLNDFLNFENQEFDYDFGGILENWG